jgi:hypothetical protein
VAAGLWSSLARGFPQAVLAVLMPNHLHVIAPFSLQGRSKLRMILAATSRRFRLGRTWAPVPGVQCLDGPDKLRRTVRYGWLNPCRPWKYAGRWRRLVDDPLAWPWSNLRDVAGAIARPWTPASHVLEALAWHDPTDVASLLDYVARDEHVARRARRPLARPGSSSLPDRPLWMVVQAALLSARAGPASLHVRGLTRSLVVGLAYRQGWYQATEIGAILDLHRTSVSRMAGRVRFEMREEIERAALCLDPRFGAGVRWTGAGGQYGWLNRDDRYLCSPECYPEFHWEPLQTKRRAPRSPGPRRDWSASSAAGRANMDA